jgi:hypothetical protein
MSKWINDRYPELGPKKRYEDLLDVIVAFRSTRHDPIVMEGSTGPERTFWSKGELVGHAWPTDMGLKSYWARITP